MRTQKNVSHIPTTPMMISGAKQMKRIKWTEYKFYRPFFQHTHTLHHHHFPLSM